ncbi:MAG: GNAT family N-acetyltransferase [Bacillota bacterium]|nr:GNAT family N-acetyltransferase [Bacillota bacterium]
MQSLNELRKKKELNIDKQSKIKLIKVRKAVESDVDGIFNVASTVGKGKNESYGGFLMDDYKKNKEYFKNLFKEKIKELEFFYIAERNKKVIGFLIGYTEEEWCKDNTNWIGEISWNPDFDLNKTKKFILTDKIAISSNYTGRGVGSKIYKRLMNDMNKANYKYIFSETIVYPVANFASLSFMKKQSFELAGTRYEKYKGAMYFDHIYCKCIEQNQAK